MGYFLPKKTQKPAGCEPWVKLVNPSIEDWEKTNNNCLFYKKLPYYGINFHEATKECRKLHRNSVIVSPQNQYELELAYDNFIRPLSTTFYRDFDDNRDDGEDQEKQEQMLDYKTKFNGLENTFIQRLWINSDSQFNDFNNITLGSNECYNLNWDESITTEECSNRGADYNSIIAVCELRVC